MVSKTEELRGRERIQQLTEMVPELSRQKVVMTDLMIRGCRHTAALDHAGRWAWPDSHDHYDYDYEEHGEEDLVEAVGHTPKYIYLKDISFFLFLDSQSPYEVKYEGRGCYWLYRDGEPVEEAFFTPCPQWFWKKTSSGKRMNLITGASERTFQLYVTTYCEYFRAGDQCRFCNLNPTMERFAKLREDVGVVKQAQDIYETYIAYAQETGIDNVTLIGGSFVNRRKEAELYLRDLEVVKRAMRDSGCGDRPINLTNQAMEAEDQLRLKEGGVTSVSWHQEVWDPRLFEVVCPGKAKNVGREHWIELLFHAVEVWGWGKAGNSFVVGAQTSPPYGDMTEEEEFESITGGIRFMASHGVNTFLASLRGNPGSLLSQARRPRVEHYLRLERECARLQQEYKVTRTRR